MASECAYHSKKRPKFRKICIGIVVALFIILLVIILLVVFLKPTKPKFILQDATIHLFNISAPNLLSTNIQVTITSRNPNDDVGIYYDRLDVSAAYRNQQITLRTAILPYYQGHNDFNVWSPYLVGVNVPISPYNGDALYQDRSLGTIRLSVNLSGRIRFKLNSYTSAHYHLDVDCPAVITFGNPVGFVVGDNAVKYQLAQPCAVSL